MSDPKNLAEALKKIKALEKRIGAMEKVRTRDPLDSLDLESESRVADIYANRQRRIESLTLAIKGMSEAGLDFRNSNDLKKGASIAIQELDVLLGKTKIGQKSYESLAKGLQSFAEMAKISSEETGNFTAQLAKHQAVLQRAGLNQSEFQAVIDTSTFSLKQNAKEVQSVNLRLAQFARESGVSTSVVSRNYNMLAKNLMVDSATIERELLRTQKVQQQTGVSVSDQQRAFSGVTTDFSAASQMAGNLNALLGGNKLSATEIFMSLTPGEVQEKVKEALKGTRMEEDLTYSGKDRNRLKARQLAIATLARNTNMSADNIRRMYGREEGEQESVQGKIARSTETRFEGFNGELSKSQVEIEAFTKTLLRSQLKLSAIFDIEQRGRIISKPTQGQAAWMGAMVAKGSGALPADISRQRVTALPTDAQMAVTELNKMRLINPTKDKAFIKIMKQIVNPKTRPAGMSKYEEEREKPMSFDGRRMSMDEILVLDTLVGEDGSIGIPEKFRGKPTGTMIKNLNPKNDLKRKELLKKVGADKGATMKAREAKALEAERKRYKPPADSGASNSTLDPSKSFAQVIQIPVSIDGTKVAEAVATVMYPSGMA